MAAEPPPASPLADLLEARFAAILQAWEARARQTSAERAAPSEPVLREEVPDFLRNILAALRQPAPLARPTEAPRPRYPEGSDINSIVWEYGLLRDILLEAVEETGQSIQMGELRILARLITTAIAEAVSHFADQRILSERRQQDTERERLVQTLEAEWARQALLADMSRALAETRLDLEAVMEATCLHAAQGLGDVSSLWLLSEDGAQLVLRAFHARDPENRARFQRMTRAHSLRLGQGPLGRVVRTGQPLLLPQVTRADVEQLADTQQPELLLILEQLGPRSLLVVPLRGREAVMGVVVLARLSTTAAYNESDQRLVEEMADRAALSLESARLFQESREAVRMREDVVAVVSHDLRNPLNAITLTATLLTRRSDLDERTAKAAARIFAAAERANRLIRDLLDFTQARVSGIPVKLAPGDLHELSVQVVEEVRSAHPERRIELHVRGDGQGVLDPDRIAQVVANLVGNAVQHSPAESPVRVSSRGEGEGLVLEVHNAGAPIPAETLPGLFEPFRRGLGAKAGAGGSLGLGLFISRRIVEAHGGRISVRSSAGEGTTFSVWLPRQPPARGPRAVPGRAEGGHVQGGSLVVPSPGAGDGSG
jgi:signal transduction histidine kinase